MVQLNRKASVGGWQSPGTAGSSAPELQMKLREPQLHGQAGNSPADIHLLQAKPSQAAVTYPSIVIVGTTLLPGEAFVWGSRRRSLQALQRG